mmetsp:Transcript_35913/g.91785  ORF Transcript_35913/g.91785 Transcript_35913/m.91785 type:complete len:500 (-) Transcript_35913:1940-3439(-)
MDVGHRAQGVFAAHGQRGGRGEQGGAQLEVHRGQLRRGGHQRRLFHPLFPPGARAAGVLCEAHQDAARHVLESARPHRAQRARHAGAQRGAEGHRDAAHQVRHHQPAPQDLWRGAPARVPRDRGRGPLGRGRGGGVAGRVLAHRGDLPPHHQHRQEPRQPRAGDRQPGGAAQGTRHRAARQAGARRAGDRDGRQRDQPHRVDAAGGADQHGGGAAARRARHPRRPRGVLLRARAAVGEAPLAGAAAGGQGAAPAHHAAGRPHVDEPLNGGRPPPRQLLRRRALRRPRQAGELERVPDHAGRVCEQASAGGAARLCAPCRRLPRRPQVEAVWAERVPQDADAQHRQPGAGHRVPVSGRRRPGGVVRAGAGADAGAGGPHPELRQEHQRAAALPQRGGHQAAARRARVFALRARGPLHDPQPQLEPALRRALCAHVARGPLWLEARPHAGALQRLRPQHQAAGAVGGPGGGGERAAVGAARGGLQADQDHERHAVRHHRRL